MMFLVIGNIPLLYVLNHSWFETLMFSTPGKVTLAICCSIVLFSFTRISSAVDSISWRSSARTCFSIGSSFSEWNTARAFRKGSLRPRMSFKKEAAFTVMPFGAGWTYRCPKRSYRASTPVQSFPDATSLRMTRRFR